MSKKIEKSKILILLIIISLILLVGSIIFIKPSDPPQETICGDGICQAPENAQFCPADCVEPEPVAELSQVCSADDFTNFVTQYPGNDSSLVSFLENQCFNIFIEDLTGCPADVESSTFMANNISDTGIWSMAECNSVCERYPDGDPKSGHQMFSTIWKRESSGEPRIVLYSRPGLLTAQSTCGQTFSILGFTNLNRWEKGDV